MGAVRWLGVAAIGVMGCGGAPFAGVDGVDAAPTSLEDALSTAPDAQAVQESADAAAPAQDAATLDVLASVAVDDAGYRLRPDTGTPPDTEPDASTADAYIAPEREAAAPVEACMPRNASWCYPAASGQNFCGPTPDGCGGTIDCGPPPMPFVCHAGVFCNPLTVTGCVGRCGLVDDGCGGFVSCRTCPQGQVCASNVCQ